MPRIMYVTSHRELQPWMAQPLPTRHMGPGPTSVKKRVSGGTGGGGMQAGEL